ncbi:MAG: M23 family metallopeptidase [Clostridia bacterium]|nr:M23 family metallopeptidase [Clostridia bacterium]
MKSYNSKLNKKNVLSVVAVLVFAVAVIGITIGFATSANQSQNADAPVLDVTKPVETFSLPSEKYTVLKEASVDKLVYMSSLNMWKTHNGIDLGLEENAQVKSVFSGKVKKVEQSTLEGVVVTVELSNGMTAIYKSLSSASVKEGDKIENGAVVGIVGTMLSESDLGTHLHLELKKDGKYVDPAEFINVVSDNK